MIEITGLGKHYGECAALAEVSLQINAGEIFAILGPNGSGKTTLLKCLAGLARPSAGHIRINGLDLTPDNHLAKANFSYLPQQVCLPDQLNAREVLQFYARLRGLSNGRVSHLLASSALNGFGERRIREYSGGMLQRLGLAIALLPDSPILLLDEPTSGLDPGASTRLRELLRELRSRQKTIVFSCHVLADVESIADRVAILLDGRLAGIEEVGGLRERLAAASRMRVKLQVVTPNLCSAARSAGATGAEIEGECLVVTCRPEQRPEVIRALGAAGASIVSFATQEPTLEDIYVRYVDENHNRSAVAAGAGLPGRPEATGH
ncbi:MAG TPA: ABC transporter ATP-binding protein [Terriglobales bacterium]|nr:ABC transporter ATP-binding protein [Terriglobales bacterium]